MISKKVRRIITLTLLFTSFIGVGNAVNTYRTNDEAKQYTKTIVIEENTKVLEKQLVVDAINEVSNLEILQMQLNKQIKIKKGEFFKKEQDIKFSINGKYILNLNNINSNNVIIDGHKILIFSTEPQIDVNFNEDKTTYSEVDKAFYTFGDIRLTPAEMESIKFELKQSIIEEMGRTTNMNIAKEKASKSIENILLKLTKSEYSVEVRWVL